MRTLPGLALLAVLLGGCRSAAPEPQRWDDSPIQFVDVAPRNGIRFVSGVTDRTPLNITFMIAGGVGFVDYDQDGWPDLVVAGIQGVRLYHNEQGGSFRDVTAGTGLDRLTGPLQGVASADYDGDGFPDLLLTRLDGVTLLRNLAGRRFQDVTRQSGLSVRGWTTSAAFADVNGDGRLDLFVGRYVRFGPGMPQFQKNGDALLALGPDAYEAVRGVFYLNTGGGRFREATAEAGLSDSHGKTLGVAFADLDRSGHQDLYLANDQSPGDFFVNDGRGYFRNVAAENGTALSGAGRPQSGMGVDWGDYDDDGRLDLVVTTFYSEPKSLYHQDAGGIFTEKGPLVGLSQAVLPGTAFGVAFADLDNDGWPDLVIANGHIQDQMDRVDPHTGFRQRSQVLRNAGGAFHDVSASAGPAFSERIVGRGLAAADFDHDGREDVAIANFGGPPLLLHNESRSGNWVMLRLRAKPPNREGIGATVILSSGGKRQARTVQTGRSYLSAFPAEAHFGIGTETAASAEIHWPDGREQLVPKLRVNAVNVIGQQR